jgi:23S rRNA (pseudouridine1915-N3)-methyltransferase
MSHWYLRELSDSDKHFSQGILEYSKRLGSLLTIRTFKPTRYWDPASIRTNDTIQFTRALDALADRTKYRVILLSLDGSSWDSMQWLDYSQNHHHIIVLLGWPYWCDEAVLRPYCDARVSFGMHTMPHWLAKLVFLEQIYRVSMIHQGRNYHY